MSKSLTKKIALASIAGASAYLSYELISNKFFDYAFKKNEIPDINDEKTINWFNSLSYEKHSITSKDNLKLSSICIKNHNTNDYILFVHGIWSNKEFMYHYAYELDKLGYNLILVDQRASGESQGEYYTYGYKESQDISDWCKYYSSINKKINICLFGVSMGAATCMMSTNKNLVKNVKCIVEDCGFTSMREQFYYMLKNKYKINKPEIILKVFESKFYKELGIKYDDVDAIKCLKTNRIPILFIHGTDDDFVPHDMCKKLYDSNLGYKECLSVEGAKHSMSYKNKKYYDVVNVFTRKHIRKKVA